MTEPKDPVQIDLTPREPRRDEGSAPMRWFGGIGVGIVFVAMLIGLALMVWVLIRLIGWTSG